MAQFFKMCELLSIGLENIFYVRSRYLTLIVERMNFSLSTVILKWLLIEMIMTYTNATDKTMAVVFLLKVAS